MPQVSLFTESELAAALSWLLPAGVGPQAAKDWFERFVDETDAQGRFLYLDWREATGLPLDTISVVAVTNKSEDASARYQGVAQHFAAMSTAERLEFLMHFSDFHLNLVSLVSPEVTERLARGRGQTPEQIERGLAQMRVIVAAMHATRGAA